VRAPADATKGTAKVKVSVPGWTGVDFSATTFEIKVED
jgi:hypothetical protein